MIMDTIACEKHRGAHDPLKFMGFCCDCVFDLAHHNNISMPEMAKHLLETGNREGVPFEPRSAGDDAS